MAIVMPSTIAITVMRLIVVIVDIIVTSVTIIISVVLTFILIAITAFDHHDDHSHGGGMHHGSSAIARRITSWRVWRIDGFLVSYYQFSKREHLKARGFAIFVGFVVAQLVQHTIATCFPMIRSCKHYEGARSILEPHKNIQNMHIFSC